MLTGTGYGHITHNQRCSRVLWWAHLGAHSDIPIVNAIKIAIPKPTTPQLNVTKLKLQQQTKFEVNCYLLADTILVSPLTLVANRELWTP